MTGHDTIAIGASAGGVEALRQLVGSLPSDLPAAIFVVLHIAPNGCSVLPSILNRCSKLPVVHPKDGELIEYGKIYVAPPDSHLLVKRGYIQLSHGPKENRHRPAIDALFRTAARYYGSRVVGVVLSGNLDDGTAGLLAIKMQGGVAIVQDPEEALYDGMPRSAIENVEVDRILPLSEMAEVLTKLAGESVHEKALLDNEELNIESDLVELDMRTIYASDRERA